MPRSAARIERMSETIYDHPLYYDILFGWDRSDEANFYAKAFERHGVAPGARIVEMACGSGQVARLLARRGWRVTGVDNRQPMLDFLREQARADGSSVDVVCADMATFSIREPFAAALNPMSSFRLLQSDAAADAHLRAMAAALRPGAVYVLDLSFTGHGVPSYQTTNESWTMQRGDITVEGTDAGVNVDDRGVRHTLAWGAETHLRPYTYVEFVQRVHATGSFTIGSCHQEIKGADDIGRFDVDLAAEPPLVGRTMVVLERISG
jgi:SAM-dependent methyltransferase